MKTLTDKYETIDDHITSILFQNYLLDAFLKIGIAPDVIRNGRKIILLEIKELQLKFITSNSYLEGNEFQLATQFGIHFDNHFFPIHFNKKSNYNYSGPIPPIEYFLTFRDTPEDILKKNSFFRNLKETNYKWTFEKELVQFCDQKVWLLSLSCLKFIKFTFNIQVLLKKSLNFDSNKDFIHPFAYQLCSLPGFVYKVYRYFYLNQYEIYCIKNEFGGPTRNVSKVEHEWSSFIQYLNPSKFYLSAFNNSRGQKFFKEAIPDLYCEETGEAIFFNGCYFHGHYEQCLINPNATPDTVNTFLKKTYLELNVEFQNKIESLLANNDCVKKVKVMWECKYYQARKTKKFNLFAKCHFKSHPLYRLCPRTTVRGAFIDVFALRWTQKENLEEVFHCYDVNGLYSYCAIKYKFMIGKYEILMGKSLSEIKVLNNEFYYNNQPMIGTMLVTILPPKDLLYPFLLYRLKNGKTVNTLCVSCAEHYSENSNLFISNTIKCCYKPNQRATTSSYFISELNFALKLGYEIIAIHECHYFAESAYILKDFVQKLNCLKLQSTDCLKYFDSDQEKLEYLQYLNEEMDLSAPFHLTLKNIKPNDQNKKLIKLMCNSLFGKLEQKNNHSKSTFVTTQAELKDIFFSDNVIEEIINISSTICQVQVKPEDSKLPPNSKANCYIGGQITAYARTFIYQNLQQIVLSKGKPFYVDTDSIFFTLPKDLIPPIPISDAVGHFKQVYPGQINCFYTLGPKNYVLKYENDSFSRSVTKLRGISLASNHVKNEITNESYDFFMTQCLKEILETKQINQIRMKICKKSKNIAPTLQLTTFKNDVSAKRIVMQNTPHLNTVPYGFETKKGNKTD